MEEKMEKQILVKISLDRKTGFETIKKEDITEEVFDSMTEAIVNAVKETINLEEDDFVNCVLENYNQKLPENFKSFKDIGFKITIEDKKSSPNSELNSEVTRNSSSQP